MRRWPAVSGVLVALVAVIVSIAPADALASWSIVPSPNNGTGLNVLDGVSCPRTRTRACTAVGYSHDASRGADETLIESGTGGHWSIVPSPNNGTNDNDLLGVSCASATSCKAVGFSTNAVGVNQTLIESWNGISWSIDSSPDNGTAYNVLDGVSCAAAKSCTAVGYFYDTDLGVTQTLIESWNGTSWSIVPSPSNGTTGNILYGVSCSRARTCTAVGYYVAGLGGFQTLVESWNGSTWSIVPSPNIGTSADLLGVSCRSSRSCMAVGSYNSAGLGVSQTLVESWNGTSWSIVPSPNAGTSNNDLLGVSCGTAGSCQAVGLYFNTSLGDYQTLIETWSGGRWSVVPSANNGLAYNVLAAVSCASARACKAVGSYYDTSLSSSQSLIESND